MRCKILIYDSNHSWVWTRVGWEWFCCSGCCRLKLWHIASNLKQFFAGERCLKFRCRHILCFSCTYILRWRLIHSADFSLFHERSNAGSFASVYCWLIYFFYSAKRTFHRERNQITWSYISLGTGMNEMKSVSEREHKKTANNSKDRIHGKIGKQFARWRYLLSNDGIFFSLFSLFVVVQFRIS